MSFKKPLSLQKLFMKNLLFALIIFPLISFSQTVEDAERFLQVNLRQWECLDDGVML